MKAIFWIFCLMVLPMLASATGSIPQAPRQFRLKCVCQEPYETSDGLWALEYRCEKLQYGVREFYGSKDDALVMKDYHCGPNSEK